jgi:hypothetical protein
MVRGNGGAIRGNGMAKLMPIVTYPAGIHSMAYQLKPALPTILLNGGRPNTALIDDAA